MQYNFKQIENKWQKKWEQKKVFVAKKKGKKFYVLEMFPYPSGEGLHMGHALNFTIGDIFARFKRMSGFNVLYPTGYDSLGLPAENAAIKIGKHPKNYTKKSTAYFTKQMKRLGFSYDWNRMINTSEPDYYRWDQWIFLKMFEKGLVYRKKAPVNWCPKCKTVLANEQVHNGKCEYHKNTNVEIKHFEQWYFKITDYVEELNDFSKLKQWPELIKKLQKNWIGKSYGTEIKFKINDEDWKVFTTRPDTIYGVTFMVVSAQHEKLMELVTEKQKKDVEKFLKKIKSVSEKVLENLEKEGVFTGSYAVNPLTNERIPVYAGNFVLADYGSGMVMAVPAHDQRDFEFAKKYKLKIKQVISGGSVKQRAYTGEGKLINSGKFNDVNSKEAIEKITRYLQKKKLGRKNVQYKLKDWLVSRQRFWGTPIPIVYCEKCGIVPVSEKNLPVKLPEKVKFGKGNPLKTNKNFVNVKCPKCKGKAKRETDTMDTFVNSSWYYLRYCDSKNRTKIFDSKKVSYWCPVDLYIGGKEHACMHLIYIRFYTKFLRDLGLLKFDEPAVKLFNQGILHAEDGNKMSKSLGNVVDPLNIVSKYGTDSLRMFLVSVSSSNSDFNWDGKGIQGIYKFIKKVFDYFNKLNTKNSQANSGATKSRTQDFVGFGKSSARVESKLNKAIKEISDDIENWRYNLAVIKIRQLFDVITKERISKKDLGNFLKLLSVFCPHVTEELWSKIGGKGFISLAD